MHLRLLSFRWVVFSICLLLCHDDYGTGFFKMNRNNKRRIYIIKLIKIESDRKPVMDKNIQNNGDDAHIRQT